MAHFYRNRLRFARSLTPEPLDSTPLSWNQASYSSARATSEVCAKTFFDMIFVWPSFVLYSMFFSLKSLNVIVFESGQS